MKGIDLCVVLSLLAVLVWPGVATPGTDTIPTVSEWAFVIFALLMLTGGKLYSGQVWRLN